MSKFSDGFALSIIKGVRKECFKSNITIPSDHLILSLLKLFLFNPEIQKDDTNIGAENEAKKLIQLIMDWLKSCSSLSIVTLKMQIYFDQNHRERTVILHSRQQQIDESIRPLQRLIIQKSVKNKEDYDQLYHHICCMVNLMNGIGDPTDNEILKETIAALKSILTTKDFARFTTKPQSLKEKQLHDIIRIVTGILVYNKNYSFKEDDSSSLTKVLENSLQKCYDFLENKLLELDERISSLIHLFLKFYTNEEIESLLSSSNPNKIAESSNCENVESGKYIKAYIICMQQFKQYSRILIKIIASLIDEFKLSSEQLHIRLQRVRKTVKFRNAIPVIEIYPQFKDISLSWDRMQEISTILNNVADIVTYLRTSFEKAIRPQFDKVPDSKKSDLNVKLDLKIRREFLSNISSQYCEHILPDDNPNFYEFNVELAGYCIVTFVETKGILVQGIKEYGFINYRNSYFSFSSIGAITNFCSSPDSYIESLLKLAFIWPETIDLLNLQKWLDRTDIKIKQVNRTEKYSKEVEVQTDLHPVPGFKSDDSKTHFQNRVIYLTQKGKYCQTHSVQTDISNFRKDMFTQTTITIKRT